MVEYIRREDAEKTASKYGCDNGSALGVHSGLADCIAYEIAKLPAADVAPVRYGRWKLNQHYGDYECSVCGNGDVITPFFYTLKMKYCPNCGAKMDGE